MKCKELLTALNDYIDGEIDPEICQEFEGHLKGCSPCQIVVDNVRRTISLFRRGRSYPLPEEFQSKLHALLREKWKEYYQ